MLPFVDSLDSLRPSRDSAIPADVLEGAARIIERVRSGGEAELRRHVEKFDRREPSQPLICGPSEFQDELARLNRQTRELLERVAARIRAFAQAQLDVTRGLEFSVPGGAAGHTWHPLAVAGCYAPGGRYPLVSSLLMTAVTARVAGVERIWVATPVASGLMLAAAAVAGADGLLAAGGAHAIAALAHGVGGAPVCDVIVGPGNHWVTAAKQIVSARIRIDMLAGPSELLVMADDSADPATVAADLLAQAEHDVDARPMLVAMSKDFAAAVDDELEHQIQSLPTRDMARRALQNGFAMVACDLKHAWDICQSIAPEHLALHLAEPIEWTARPPCCGCLFIGGDSAEVLGDYGAGPNHVLPTGGTARFASGLSVETFLRRQTWLRIDQLSAARSLTEDAKQMAELEGLSAHAASAKRRLGGNRNPTSGSTLEETPGNEEW